MKFFIVSRKKYEQELNNKKIINEERKKLAKKNVELQKENQELKRQIEVLELNTLSKIQRRASKNKETINKNIKRGGKKYGRK